MKSLETQVGGTHYKDMGIQPWEIIKANKLDFWEGSALKYLLRYKTKNGVEDLRKIQHYIDYLIEREEAKNVTEGKLTPNSEASMILRRDAIAWWTNLPDDIKSTHIGEGKPYNGLTGSQIEKLYVNAIQQNIGDNND